MDNANRIGDGKSIGYEVVSSSTAEEEDDADAAAAIICCCCAAAFSFCVTCDGSGGKPTDGSSSSLSSVDICSCAIRPIMSDDEVAHFFAGDDGRLVKEVSKKASDDDIRSSSSAATTNDGVDMR